MQQMIKEQERKTRICSSSRKSKRNNFSCGIPPWNNGAALRSRSLLRAFARGSRAAEAESKVGL